MLLIAATTGVGTFRVGNASALIVDATTAGAISAATPHILTVRYEEGRTPKEYTAQIDGVEVIAVDTSAAPTANDASNVLTLAETSAGTGPWAGEIGGAWFASSVWTDAEVALLETWATRYGVTLP